MSFFQKSASYKLFVTLKSTFPRNLNYIALKNDGKLNEDIDF